MAGGVHADHSDVEATLAKTFTATGKPFTDAQIDAMCQSAERRINMYLKQYGKALPTAASNEWKEVVVELVIHMMGGADRWDKAGGSTSTASEMGTASYPGRRMLPNDIQRAIEFMIADTEGGVTYGDSVS